jgi:FG-GAP-like repeat
VAFVLIFLQKIKNKPSLRSKAKFLLKILIQIDMKQDLTRLHKGFWQVGKSVFARHWRRTCWLLTSLLIGQLAMAQAPGGVNTGLKTWVKADAGVSAPDGGTVAQWSDQSGNNYHFTNTGLYQPTYFSTNQSKLLNFNPVIDFDGVFDHLRNTTVLMPNTSAYTFLSVAMDEDAGTGYRQVFSSQQFHDYLGLYKQGGAWYDCGWIPYAIGGQSKSAPYWGDRGQMGRATKFSPAGGANGFWNGTNFTTDGRTKYAQPQIVGFGSLNAATTDPFYTYTDGFKYDPNWSPIVDGLGFRTPFFKQTSIGADINVEVWKGRIPEFMAWNRTLTDAEMAKVNTYLAIKYGITLGQGNGQVKVNGNNYNYVSSAGTVIWDATANAAYKGSIAGIGRDNASGLHQKQARSIQDSFQVTMGLTTLEVSNAGNTASLTDGSFMLWGNDNGVATFNTAISPAAGLNANTRFGRIWKVQETGTVGTVKFAIPASASLGNTVYLVRSTDATFDGNDTWTPLSNLTVGTLNYLAGDVDFSNGDYFTIATAVATPGCVAASLQLWIKADAGTVFAGATTNLTDWKDQSALARQWAYVSSDPQLVNNAVNFNPSVNFDGNDWFRTDPYGGYTNFTDAFTAAEVFSVTKAFNNWYNNGNSFEFGGHYNSHYVWGNGYVYNEFGSGNRKAWHPVTKAVAEGGGTVTGPSVDVTQFNLFNVYSATNDWQAAFNGTTAYSTTTNTVNFSSNPGGNHIGASYAFPYYGDISEVVLYNRKLTLAERQRVNTYLGIKYGLTIGHNYLSGSGTVIYDTTGYKNHIVAIGRDNCQGLHQKQSKSINNTEGYLTLSLGAVAANNAANTNSFATDSTFEIVGHNGLSKNFSTTYAPASFTPATTFYRMPRIWKVQEKGTVGTVRITVPKGAERLLVSNAATFVPASTQEIEFQADGAGNFYAEVDFTDGQFFTFGRAIAAPGCVAADLKLWLKADDGGNVTITDENKVSSWTNNLSPNVTVVQANTAKQPDYLSNGMNFNPAFDFKGAQVLFSTNVGTNIYDQTTDPTTILAVSTNRATNDWWRALINFDGNDDFPSPNLDWFNGKIVAYTYATTHTDTRHTTQIPLNTPTIGYVRQDNSSPGTVKVGFNGLRGEMSWTGADQSYVAGQTEMGIGAETDGAREPHDGLMSEVVVYDRVLTDAEMRRVNSYLGIKYGITVSHPYFSGANATVYDTTGYANNIFGIGRDDCQSLNQKQSRSANAGIQPTMGLGTVATNNAENTNSFSADRSFSICGDNGLTSNYAVAFAPTSFTPTNPFKRMNRVWKVQETGTVGTVKISVPASSSAQRLLVSSSNTFPAGGSTQEILLVAEGKNMVATVDLTNGQFFTFGRELIPVTASGNDGYSTDGLVTGTTTPNTCGASGFFEKMPLIDVGDFGGPNMPGGFNYMMQTGVDGAQQSFLGDLDNDGKLDMLWVYDAGGAAAQSGTVAWMGNGDGTFNHTPIIDKGEFTGNIAGINNIIQAGLTGAEATYLTDVNGDGRLDVLWIYDAGGAAANSGAWTWLGNGDGTFAHTPIIDKGAFTGTIYGANNILQAGISANESTHVADVNGDGKIDIVGLFDGACAAANSGTWVWLGNGDGTFAHTPIIDKGAFGPSVVCSGLDNVIQAGYSANEFTSMADMNNDGKVDIIWIYDNGGAAANSGTWVWTGNGDGTFAHTPIKQQGVFVNSNTPFANSYIEAGISANEHTRIADVNGDNKMDIVWIYDGGGAADNSGVWVWTGNGDGTFATTPVVERGLFRGGAIPGGTNFVQGGTSGAENSFIGDLNNDGKVDILWTYDAGGTPTSGSYVWLGASCPLPSVSPGCVPTNLLAWYKADDITNTEGGVLATWRNSVDSTYNIIQAAAGARPTYFGTTAANLVNFNPSVSFDGGDELYSSVRLFNNTKPFSMVAFSVDRRTNAGELRAPMGGGYGNGNFIGLDFQTDGNSPFGFNPYSAIDAEWVNTSPTYRLNALGKGGANTHGNITGLTSNNVASGSNNIISYVNGAKDLTTISANQNAGFGNGVYVGSSGDANWLGLVPEVIIYDRQLSDVEMQRLYSYLAIKYGTTLKNHYLSGSGTRIYDTTGYANDVFGIGRDSCQGLHQKQAKSSNPFAFVTISNGARGVSATNALNTNGFAADSTFEMIGDNGLSPATIVAYTPTSFTPALPFKRMERIWKVQEKGTVGEVTIKVKSNVTHILIDNDGDGNFATGAKTEKEITGNEVSFDFANGALFTFGKEIQPLNCSSGLAFVHGDDAANSSNSSTIGISAWRSNGNGTFSQTVVRTSGFNRDGTGSEVFGNDGRSATYASDVDNDGDKDIVHVTEDNSNSIYVYLNNADGTFETVPVVTTNMQSVTDGYIFAGESAAEQGWMGDANNDGYPDYIFSGNDSKIHVYLNNGDGTFQQNRITTSLIESSGYNTSGVSGSEQFLLADVNNDGAVDIVGTYDPGILVVYLGNGDGTFITVPYFQATLQDSGGSNSSGSADNEFSDFADVDGDGDLDYIHAEYHDSTPQWWTYLNKGDGSFNTTAVLTQASTAPLGDFFRFANYIDSEQSFFADVNNDGKADYITTRDNGNATTNGIAVYLATTGGSFAVNPITTIVPTGFATGIAAGETSFMSCGFVVCRAGSAAPVLSANTATNACPASTANLGTITASNQPSGTKLTWHTELPATLANKVADSSAVAAGKYYAVIYDAANGCFSNGGSAADSVTVTINFCLAPPMPRAVAPNAPVAGNAATELAPTGGVAPYVYSIDNTCTNPGGGAQPLPAGSNLSINASTGAYGYTVPAAGGTYYYCIKVCDSQTPTAACQTVTYFVDVACNAGVIAPALTATTATNFCPATTINLSTITATNLPPATALTWHTATPATSANKVADSTAVAAGTYYAAFTDFDNDCVSTLTTSVTATVNSCSSILRVRAKAFLSGAYNQATGLMHDSLRVKGIITPAQPFGTGLGYVGTETVLPAVTAITGSNAIVDWVLLELRSDTATTTIRRAALLQRDGDIVDVDGISPVSFTAAAGDYYIVVKHRNHLGVMTAAKVTLGTLLAVPVDFTTSAQPTFQRGGAFGNPHAQRTFGSVRALWGGNASGNGNIISSGSGSDGSATLNKVLLAGANTLITPSFILNNIYTREDVNLDGKVIYQGTGNELTPILINILNHPSNTNFLTTFIIYEQVP